MLSKPETRAPGSQSFVPLELSPPSFLCHTNHMKRMSTFPNHYSPPPAKKSVSLSFPIHHHIFMNRKKFFHPPKKGQHIHKVQSSPGYLQVGHVPSNCTRQIPHTSSSGMSQRQEATAFHSLIVTFMVGGGGGLWVKGGGGREGRRVGGEKIRGLGLVSFWFIVH